MAGERRAKTFQCPSCGSPQEIVALGHTKTYACPACSAVIDMSKPEYEIVLKSQDAEKRPLIPLGSRGTIKNVLWEVIGFSAKTDGTRSFHWSEYLLFNPYHGFRWLVESDGHWNFGTPIKQQPRLDSKFADYRGSSFKEFLSGQAITTFILGEFYWEARAGDEAYVADYIDPPRMLSVENTSDETNWTLLEYQDPQIVEQVFHRMVKQVGVAPNQPNPHQWRFRRAAAASVAAAVCLLFAETALGRFQLNKKVYEGTVEFSPADPTKIRVIPDLVLGGRTSNVELRAASPVQNSWIFLDYALSNNETGESFGTTSEVSFYEGHDSDGHWTEGSRSASVVIPAVPPGKYSLTIEPELPPGASASCNVSVTRDVPVYSTIVFGFFALSLAPLILGIKSAAFEGRRWQNNDDSED